MILPTTVPQSRRACFRRGDLGRRRPLRTSSCRWVFTLVGLPVMSAIVTIRAAMLLRVVSQAKAKGQLAAGLGASPFLARRWSRGRGEGGPKWSSVCSVGCPPADRAAWPRRWSWYRNEPAWKYPPTRNRFVGPLWAAMSVILTRPGAGSFRAGFSFRLRMEVNLDGRRRCDSVCHPGACLWLTEPSGISAIAATG